MIVYEGEGTGGEEIGRYGQIACILGAQGEGLGCEAVDWDMGKGGGEDGGFGGVER